MLHLSLLEYEGDNQDKIIEKMLKNYTGSVCIIYSKKLCEKNTA